MKDEAPIVFIHYGYTPYLKYTLDIAKKTNPDKEVVLLGDNKNKKYGKIGVRHFYFNDYGAGEEIEMFNEVFRFIAGAKHGKKEWVKFVFKRWFYIHNFIKKNNIDKFWTFDSDTLILSPLTSKEKRFKDYDCTEQCNGSCMNGFVNNVAVVKNYVDKINELFQRNDYLEKQREKFEKMPGYAFTEMRAYRTFKKESGIKTIRLNEIIDNETFDECLCQEHGMEMEYDNYLKRKIKKLYFRNGDIYEKIAATDELVKLNSINLSWVTTSFIEKVYYYKTRGKFPPFCLALLKKISRIPRFIKVKITKEVK